VAWEPRSLESMQTFIIKFLIVRDFGCYLELSCVSYHVHTRPYNWKCQLVITCIQDHRTGSVKFQASRQHKYTRNTRTVYVLVFVCFSNIVGAPGSVVG
jgi:hypothetical protein